MTLPTCPREDCTASARHYHRPSSTHRCLKGADYCQRNHGVDIEQISASRCYAPRTPQPQPAAVVLPTVDEAARVIPEAWANPSSVGSVHLIAAQAVLDLIAARLPVWHPVEPGTVIKAGTRVREVWPDGDEVEWTAAADFARSPSGSHVFIDPRTVPVEPGDPCVELVARAFHDRECGCAAPVVTGVCDAEDLATWTDLARDLLARIDAVSADA